MRQRIVTAAIFTPAMLALLVLNPAVAHITLVLIAFLALFELRSILAHIDLHLIMPPLILFFAANFALPNWSSEYFYGFLLLYLAVLLGYACLTYPRISLGSLGVNLLAALYPLPALLCAVQLRYSSQGWEAILLALIFTWAYDTCAYLGGSALGKHYLFPGLSPKKSIEGVICGAIGALLAGFAFNAVIPHFTMMQMIPIALVAGLLAQLGDLVESMLKRFGGVKDSGNLLPGHGGVLDRFDAFFFVVVWISFIYAIWGV